VRAANNDILVAHGRAGGRPEQAMQDFNDQFFSDAPLVTYADALARARAARTAAGDVVPGARYFCAGNEPVTSYQPRPPLEWDE
jgi:hypothetical protein